MQVMSDRSHRIRNNLHKLFVLCLLLHPFFVLAKPVLDHNMCINTTEAKGCPDDTTEKTYIYDRPCCRICVAGSLACGKNKPCRKRTSCFDDFPIALNNTSTPDLKYTSTSSMQEPSWAVQVDATETMQTSEQVINDGNNEDTTKVIDGETGEKASSKQASWKDPVIIICVVTVILIVVVIITCYLKQKGSSNASQAKSKRLSADTPLNGSHGDAAADIDTVQILQDQGQSSREVLLAAVAAPVRSV